MKCVFCGNDLTKSQQTIERRVNRKIFYIKNVPVDECKVCGEVYVDDDVISGINSAIESGQSDSVNTTVLDFDHVVDLNLRAGSEPFTRKLALS